MILYKLFRKVYTFDEAVEKLASGKWNSHDEFCVDYYEFVRFRLLVLDGYYMYNGSSYRDTNIGVLKKWLEQNMDKYVSHPDIHDLNRLEKFIKYCRHVRRIDIFDDKETYMVWRGAIKSLYYDWYKLNIT